MPTSLKDSEKEEAMLNHPRGFDLWVRGLRSPAQELPNGAAGNVATSPIREETTVPTVALPSDSY